MSWAELQQSIADPDGAVDIDGESYPVRQVSFHPVIIDGQHARYYPSDWDPGEPLYNVKVLGDGGGLQTGSDTVLDRTDGNSGWHLDVENSPHRPGHLHLQYKLRDGTQVRHIYDFHRGVFLPANAGKGKDLDQNLLEEVLNDPRWEEALDDARAELNVPEVG